jgi:hypothetical protein
MSSEILSDPGAAATPIAGEPPRLADRAEPGLIMHLEPDQLVLETLRPVARAQLGRRTLLALWALRIFSIILSLMVIYTFIERLS